MITRSFLPKGPTDQNNDEIRSNQSMVTRKPIIEKKEQFSNICSQSQIKQPLFFKIQT